LNDLDYIYRKINKIAKKAIPRKRICPIEKRYHKNLEALILLFVAVVGSFGELVIGGLFKV